MSPCCWDNISSFKGIKMINNLIQIIIIIIATKTKNQGNKVTWSKSHWSGRTPTFSESKLGDSH